MNGGPIARVCFSTGCHHHSVAVSKRAAQGQVQATHSTHHERGADRLAGKRSRQGPGDPGAGIGRQPSPGWSFPSERTIYSHRSLHYTTNTPRAFQPKSIRSLSLAILNIVPPPPSGSSQGHHRRMAGKSYWDVALRGGLKRAGQCNCQRMQRYPGNSTHNLLP